VFIAVSVYFIIDSVRKLLDTPSYSRKYIWVGNCGSPVSTVTRLGVGQTEFASASIQALGHSQPPVKWVLRVLSQKEKQPGREADR